MISGRRLASLTSAGLRLASLVAKLGLTLYMAKFLSLADMGIYGLVFATVMTSTVVLGGRLDYIMSREIVRADERHIVAKVRDQSIFYFTNYIVVGVIALFMAMAGLFNLPPQIWLLATALVILESFANLLYVNLNAMEKQVTASAIFFVRSGGWVFVVILMGLLAPQYRTIEYILIAWLIGCGLSIIATLWVWRHLPWATLKLVPIHWAWLWDGIKKCKFIWLGAMGLSLGAYVDRFVVNHYLGLDLVGIATFYFSFTNAILTLAQSGVLAFAGPRLVAHHKHNDEVAFYKEERRALRDVIISTSVMCGLVALIVPVLGGYLGNSGFTEHVYTLWLMLAGVALRTVAETLYYVLFARHQDKAIWLGNLLFLIPAFGCNALFVPYMGLAGIGWGAVVASAFLLVWRAIAIKKHQEAIVRN